MVIAKPSANSQWRLEFACLDSSPPSASAGPLKCIVNDDSLAINSEWSKSKSTGASHIKRYIIEKRQQGSTKCSKVCKASFTKVNILLKSLASALELSQRMNTADG